MSETVWLTLIAAVSSIATMLITTLASRKSDKIVAKSDELINKTGEIHILANSNFNRVTAALDVANERIAGFEKLIAANVESKKEAQLKAETDTQNTLTDAVIAASRKAQDELNPHMTGEAEKS